VGDRTLQGVTLMAAVPAFGIDLGDFSPMKWLGDAAAVATADGWKGAMVALWSAAMWALAVAFRVIDTFSDPDLSSTGPLRAILPYTFGIGASVAALMVLLQLGTIAWKRDGQSLARVLVGTAQFGAVWTVGLTAASAITAAAAGLTKALLRALLNVDSFAAVASSFSGPREVHRHRRGNRLGHHGSAGGPARRIGIRVHPTGPLRCPDDPGHHLGDLRGRVDQ